MKLKLGKTSAVVETFWGQLGRNDGGRSVFKTVHSVIMPAEMSFTVFKGVSVLILFN